MFGGVDHRLIRASVRLVLEMPFASGEVTVVAGKKRVSRSASSAREFAGGVEAARQGDDPFIKRIAVRRGDEGCCAAPSVRPARGQRVLHSAFCHSRRVKASWPESVMYSPKSRE